MFEIEQMEQQFDYSLVDNDTAEFLRSCEYEINGIAEDARVKFGTVLIKAKEKLSNGKHGVFRQWHESGGISKDEANFYMNLSLTSRNLDNKKNEHFLKAPKTVQKKVMQKNTPEKMKEAVLSGEITTNKEFEALKKQYEKQLEAKNELIASREKENELLQSKLEDAENKEPEIIERYSEPDDYQEVKKQLEQSEREQEELKEQLRKWHLTDKERQEKSRKYDELNEAIKEMDSKLSEGQLRFKNRKFVNDLVTQSRILMKEVAPLTYSIESLHPDDLEKMKKSLNDLAGDLYKISKDIKEKMGEGIVVNE